MNGRLDVDDELEKRVGEFKGSEGGIGYECGLKCNMGGI